MAGDPFPIGEETDAEKTERLRVISVWQKVMKTPEGQEVLAEILRELGLFTRVHGERMAGRHDYAMSLFEHMQTVNQTFLSQIIERLINGHDEQPEE